jgi:hypothetical protein
MWYIPYDFQVPFRDVTHTCEYSTYWQCYDILFVCLAGCILCVDRRGVLSEAGETQTFPAGFTPPASIFVTGADWLVQIVQKVWLKEVIGLLGLEVWHVWVVCLFLSWPIIFILCFFPAVGYVLVLGWTSESLTERFRENSFSGSVHTCGKSPYLLGTCCSPCMDREDLCLYNFYILGVMKILRVSKEIWWILFKSCVDMDMLQNAWNWRTVMCWNKEEYTTHWTQRFKSSGMLHFVYWK